jgi:2-polyprenyl-3-methyl-5-hydroxy-6-metoxy-1,4-benzoquinol methylase
MDFQPPIQNGQVNAAYTGERNDVIALIPSQATKVLDIGCSIGAMGEALQQRGHSVTGIEASPELAAQARTRLSQVIEGDVESLAQADDKVGGPYDCVIFADVLEHLRDPWSVTKWASTLLNPGGSFVISVPNIRHWHLVRSVLLRRHWPTQDVGIFDRTHLRWFALRNLPELLEGTGLRITDLQRTYMLDLNPAGRSNRIAPYLGDFGTLQFVFRAEETVAP